MASGEMVYGICSNRNVLEAAVESLKNAGFSASDVAFLAPESLGKSGLTTEKSTKAPEGAAAGAGSGLLLGGALGWWSERSGFLGLDHSSRQDRFLLLWLAPA